jgi:hypothetical protein
MAQQAWQLSVLDDDPQPFDQLRCPRLCENLPDTVVVLVPRVLLSLPEPLVPDP